MLVGNLTISIFQHWSDVMWMYDAGHLSHISRYYKLTPTRFCTSAAARLKKYRDGSAHKFWLARRRAEFFFRRRRGGTLPAGGRDGIRRLSGLGTARFSAKGHYLKMAVFSKTINPIDSKLVVQAGIHSCTSSVVLYYPHEINK